MEIILNKNSNPFFRLPVFATQTLEAEKGVAVFVLKGYLI